MSIVAAVFLEITGKSSRLCFLGADKALEPLFDEEELELPPDGVVFLTILPVLLLLEAAVGVVLSYIT